jgi:MFS family permease
VAARTPGGLIRGLASRRWGGLMTEPDFLKLWGGLTISQLGAQVSGLALPLAAVGMGATATEMGVLGALRWLPYLLFRLVAGAWLDRIRRRSVLVATHVGRAVLLAAVPIAALVGGLRIELLFVVAFGAGTLTVLSDGAYQSLPPTIVPRERLVEANSRFSLSFSIAQVAGPGVGGILVQALTAPIAVALDALAFAVDAVLVLAIRTPEPPPAPRAGETRLADEIAEGLRWVFGNGSCDRSS